MAWDDIRAAAYAAADSAAGLVALISDDDLTRPGLGTWDVRALSGHLLRALRTPVGYLGEPEPTEQALESAAAYLGAYLCWRSDNPAKADARVASRGAAEMATAGAVELQEAFQRAVRELRALDGVHADRLLPTAFGAMRLADYLRTRTFEMVVHTLDLARALDQDWDVPTRSVEDALTLLVEVAVATGAASPLLLELTGRVSEASVLPLLQ